MHQLKLQSDNVKPEATEFAPEVQYIYSPYEVSCDNIENYMSAGGEGERTPGRCSADEKASTSLLGSCLISHVHMSSAFLS